MSKFSKYVLKKKYGDKFFDFKDENNRIRVFTYTIEKKFESKEKILDNFFEVLNSNKTLVSRQVLFIFYFFIFIKIFFYFF